MEANKKGICPVCKGTKRVPAGDYKYKHVIAGYDRDTDTFECDNCGGQYQWCIPSGEVPLRPDGTPCTHHYLESNIRMCLHRYTCEHCGDQYEVDSSD